MSKAIPTSILGGDYPNRRLPRLSALSTAPKVVADQLQSAPEPEGHVGSCLVDQAASRFALGMPINNRQQVAYLQLCRPARCADKPFANSHQSGATVAETTGSRLVMSCSLVAEERGRGPSPGVL